MSTAEQRRDERREAMAESSVELAFDVRATLFRVPEWPGLLVTHATYEVLASVTPDSSGDGTTPNGAPDVLCGLGELKSYDIINSVYDELPKWLQEHLVVEWATELDTAFLDAVGGNEALEAKALEQWNADS